MLSFIVYDFDLLVVILLFGNIHLVFQSHLDPFSVESVDWVIRTVSFFQFWPDVQLLTSNSRFALSKVAARSLGNSTPCTERSLGILPSISTETRTLLLVQRVSYLSNRFRNQLMLIRRCSSIIFLAVSWASLVKRRTSSSTAST